ncbi:MAG: methylmalonyl-CoA mutase family protein [Deltaproteobacteria bacterium]|nr:methylmalonyl-CoA mutase family protein [Deltaproteobacteria bacterium]
MTDQDSAPAVCGPGAHENYSAGQDHVVYAPKNPVRVVTATSLFDGHDASINIIRRMLMSGGVEVIHLGHNRSVDDVVAAAIDEDVQGIAISSYQGGHMEFFRYLVDLLKERGAGHIRVFGGGGGVIVPAEIRELEAYGVEKIYSPGDGARMGLIGMINDMVRRMDFLVAEKPVEDIFGLGPDNIPLVSRCITCLENFGAGADGLREKIRQAAESKKVPVVGITGSGGAGKSSLTDEVILRLVHDFPEIKVAVVCTDPSRRKTGGALLGDRIRMNSIDKKGVYMRSLATRNSQTELSSVIAEAVRVLKAAGFDLVIAETAGIGQGDTAIVDLVDIPVYVMTGEFGAATQLEKIDMLDYADLVVVNKYEKQGGPDAVRLVAKQVQRNREAWDRLPEDMPVFGTSASKFNDDGVTAFYLALLDRINEKCGLSLSSPRQRPAEKVSTSQTLIIPGERVRYLSEIAETVRGYHKETRSQMDAVRKAWHLEEAAKAVGNEKDARYHIEMEAQKARGAIEPETESLLESWPALKKNYSGREFCYTIRNKEFRVPLKTQSLSHTAIPKVALPQSEDPAEIYRFLREENLAGYFPYTAGVFPFKRMDEDPTRMFAGEGDPARTNRRFKMLSANSEATRLSTAFDSVTLYGRDPDRRPDIFGKIGNSGVSVCTVEDVKVLYGGFDLCAPSTSVSMTINGPAPIMLAMFLNTAIDQQAEKFRSENGREPTAEEYAKIKATALSSVRGTVQADILKEDQGQNTCIFSTEFALKIMGDIQEFFIKNNVRNFYSVSISGYHIAEAGANPITQLALTLANGFTYVEYYLSRGMPIDSFAPNFSFFFSNGMDPEYTVIGRVARRIWAIAMRERYKASPRSQMLKYHVQTSGRSLHSQDIQFNDIRTTLQGLCAIYDNCNSLHTNAFDEAITTPTAESVRRALAIQLIINREWGLAKNENPNQGSYIVDELTRLVEEAVLMEFDRITTRGGVLGAMELGYQRGRIQDESVLYETRKHSGELPIIGVNTFLDPDKGGMEDMGTIELARSTDREKDSQLTRLAAFQKAHENEAPEALARLQKAALTGENLFNILMDTVRVASLGQITEALYSVGGRYRRNM